MEPDDQPDARDLRERVADLEATVSDQQETIQKLMPSRRQAMVGAGLLGGGLLGGRLSTGTARAQAAGRQGTVDEPNDMFAWDLDVQNGATFNGSDLTGVGELDVDQLNTDWLIDAGDYGTLQSALDDAESSGVGLVVVPPGDYALSSTLEIPDGVVLSGEASPVIGWRPRLLGDAGVDPVVSSKTTAGQGVGMQRAFIVPDGSENAWMGDLEFGFINLCGFAGDVLITSDGTNNSRRSEFTQNIMQTNDITADTGVSASFLIAHNKAVGTITSNNATEGTNT